jgi:hypothetical protein
LPSYIGYRYIGAMRRVVMSLLAILVAGGCGGAPGRPYSFAGWPDLPATVAADPEPPDLPASGPVGRGALVLASRAGVVVVLEDGRQFRLPPPPRGEGRQGRTMASLSPDGRWLGYRRPGFFRDPVYRIRDLLSDAVVPVEAVPRGWSPDARFLLADVPTAPLLIEPANGKVRTVDSDGVVAVLPDGRILSVTHTETAVRIEAGSAVRDVALGASPDHECWCPALVTVAPGLDAVVVLLRHQSGIIPGTSEKSRPLPGNPARLVVLDRDTGTERHRVELPAGEDETWWLLADTGTGVLVRHGRPDVDELVLVDPATGTRRVVLRPPRDVVVAVPGEVLHEGE